MDIGSRVRCGAYKANGGSWFETLWLQRPENTFGVWGWGLGFRFGLGFRDFGFRGLGFRG